MRFLESQFGLPLIGLAVWISVFSSVALESGNGTLAAVAATKGSIASEAVLDESWGPVVEGFQLSIRCSKTTYVVGEPILVTVTIKNTTDTSLQYGAIGRWPIAQLFVINSRKQLVPRVPLLSGGGPSVHEVTLMPLEQLAGETVLNEKFQLNSAGSYLLYARDTVHTLDRQGTAEIVSGNVIFEIVDPSGGSGSQKAPGEAPGAATPISSLSVRRPPPGSNGPVSYFAGIPTWDPKTGLLIEPEPAARKPLPGLKTRRPETSPKAASSGMQANTSPGWLDKNTFYGLVILMLAGGTAFWLYCLRSRNRPPRK